jgi:hypothetical protein
MISELRAFAPLREKKFQTAVMTTTGILYLSNDDVK